MIATIWSWCVFVLCVLVLLVWAVPAVAFAPRPTRVPRAKNRRP
jgi:hypothetical protein